MQYATRCLFSAAAFAWLAAQAVLAAPNIVFILTDDQGHGDFGLFFQNARKTNNVRSEPWHTTPHLDTLGSEGVRLPRHYCPAPVCAPSRASLLLGVHQGHANVRDNQFDKALQDNHTLANVLKRAGYATALVGKWGLQGSGSTPATWPAFPTKRGFDYYFGYVRHGDGHEHYPKEGLYRGTKECYEGVNNITPDLDKCYTTDLFTARAKKWIVDHRTANPSQPFFLFLSFDTPHAVLELPTQAYPAGGGTNGGLQWLGTPGNMISTASGVIDSYLHPDYATATWDHDNNSATAEVAWPNVYRRYATSVRRIDDCVGDLVTLMKHLGIDTNTLIVFTSDNGPSRESYLPEAYEPTFFNSFGLHDGIKRDTWEGGIRVGALVRWPGVVRSNFVSEFASGFWDWLPTFSAAAGLPAPARTDGVSLLPLLTGTGTQATPLVYLEYFEGGTTPSYAEFAPNHRGRSRQQMQVLFHGDHKGVRYNVTSAADNFEIYDMTSDPQETNNLAGTPAMASLQQFLKDRVLQIRRPDASAPRPYDSAFIPGVDGAAFTNGVLACASYVGTWPWVPEFASLNSVSTGLVTGLDLGFRPRDTNFGLAFSGFITVPADADYTFYLTSDSGAHLRIHDATVIDDDFNRTGAEVSGTIRLKAGRHPFRLYYRHESGSRALALDYSSAGVPRQPVPAAAFSIPGAPDPKPAALDDRADTGQNVPILIPVLANDTDDGTPAPLSIVLVSPPNSGTAVISGTQVIYTPAANFLGEASFQYTITDGTNTASATVRVSVHFRDGSVWFPFNEASGFETTESAGEIVGTLAGFTSNPSPWVAGKWGRGLEFSGSQSVALGGGYLPPAGTSARTTAAWIRGSGVGAIIAWGPNATSRKWHMRLENGTPNTGALRVEIGGGYVRGTRDLRDNQWHHVAGVLPALASPNATEILLYVDGQLETLSAATASPINTDNAPATIGLDSQDRYYTGIIDEARIYNRALSAAEIVALYSATNQSAAAWHRRFFGDALMNWYSDDDSDRGVRLLEYSLGSQPLIPDPEAMSLFPEIINNRLQVTFPRRVEGTHELNYQVQLSPDLLDWNTLTASESGLAPSSLPGFELVTFRADSILLDQSPLYLRLKINWQ